MRAHTRTRDALRTLLFSFTLSALKAHLCRADLFSRLEDLQLFGDELGIEHAEPIEDAESTEGTERALHSVRAAGKAQLGLWLCDWGRCANMEGPSELQLVTKPCPGRCTAAEPAVECSQRYCSRACQAKAWREGHKVQCPGSQQSRVPPPPPAQPAP
jgi:hypothetical protein